MLDFSVSSFIAFSLLINGVLSKIQLTESGGGTLKPGQSLRLSCTVTGTSINDRYYYHWVRQPPTKGLEWLGRGYDGIPSMRSRTRSNWRPDYASAFSSRISITPDFSKNVVSLQLDSLVAEDTATYYCAREYSGWFDYWGQGTMVTVTSATPTAPTVFPLSPCHKDLSTASHVTMGCLVSGYFPDPVTLQWNEGAISTGFQNFPPVAHSTGHLTSSSQLTVPAAKWRDEKFRCNVAHAPTSYNKPTPIPPCEKQEPIAPEVRLLHSSCKSRASGATIELLCIISGFYPSVVTVEWLVDGKRGQVQDPVTEIPRKDTTGNTFSTTSRVNVSQAHWLEGKNYACQVTHPGSQTTVKGLAKKCKDDSSCVPTEIKTYLLPPTPKDLFLNRDPKLYCHVVNLETDEGLEVTWVREKKNPMSHEALRVTEQPNGTYRALSVASVTLRDWNDGETFTCSVKQEGLAAPITRSIFKKRVEIRAPKVYLYVPHHEEITLRNQILTLTCLVKGFNPTDISIQWLKDHNALPEDSYINLPVSKDKTNESYFTYSKLDIPAADWNTGHSYSCMVVHEGLPMKFTQRSVEKSQGKK